MKFNHSIRTNIQQLWAGILLAGTLLASAVPVTFRVNMEYQISQGNFFPDVDLLEARGSFQSPDQWSRGFALTNLPGTTIYQGTYEVTNSVAGNTLEFKFVNVWGGNDFDAWETSINNRTFVLDTEPQTLPVYFFNDEWAGGALIPVTFQVNMAVQTARGAFNPATDVVEARGSFNGWSGGFILTNSPADTNVYSGTWEYSLKPPGALVEYKFIVNGSGWESINNRSFIMPESELTLPVSWFNDQTGSLVRAAVLFQVDMSVQAGLGFFDGTNDEVWVDGNYLGWGDPPEGLQLFEDANQPGVYTNLFATENLLTDDPLRYKFVIWRTNMHFKVWEAGDDKVLAFDGTEPTNADGYHLKIVGPVLFDSKSSGDVLSEDTLVTFQVSMTNAVGTDGTVFDPMINGVWINGDFVGWWPWNSMPFDCQMMRDDPDGLVYSWQRLFLRGSPVRVDYKYGIDSRDNEAGFATNHVGYIRSLGSYVMPLDTFSSMIQTPPVGDLSIGVPCNGWINLSWEGRPGIHLQCATNLIAPLWEDLTDTDGLSSYDTAMGAGYKFFRLVKP